MAEFERWFLRTAAAVFYATVRREIEGSQLKAILTSRRFNPGHISHIEANAKLLAENGYEVTYRLHKEFSRFNEVFGNVTLRDCLRLQEGDLFIVWFPSIAALADLALVKSVTPARTVFVYHEPYTSFASYRASGFGILQVLRIKAISLVNKLLCAFADKIILPSDRAFRAVPEASNMPSRFAKFNLIFADESTPSDLSSARQWISYIGTIAEDHAFSGFVDLVSQCSEQNLLEPFQFLIASRSTIPSKLVEKVKSCVASGRLTIVTGKPLTNAEINRFYSKSHIVWNAYRRSMQSGVLAKSYMFGTPVIVSRSNVDANFADGLHGCIISSEFSVEEFVGAVQRISQRWPEMSKNCRDYYLHNFDYRALSSGLMGFVQG